MSQHAATSIRSKNGTLVKTCDSYKYLGTLVGLGWRADLRRRKGQAWHVIHRFNWIWKSPNRYARNRDAKRRLFQALVEPIVTYSTASYPWTVGVRKALDETLQDMYRYCLNARVDYNTFRHVPIEDLLHGQPFFSAKIAAQRLQHFGHRLRQHYRNDDTIHHPMFDVYENCPREPDGVRKFRRGGAQIESPFSAVLEMISVSVDPHKKQQPFRTMQEIYDKFFFRLGEEKQRLAWRDVVRDCLLYYQLDAAQRISTRRGKESRRPTPWSEGDHDQLIKKSTAVAQQFSLDAGAAPRRNQLMP